MFLILYSEGRPSHHETAITGKLFASIMIEGSRHRWKYCCCWLKTSLSSSIVSSSAAKHQIQTLFWFLISKIFSFHPKIQVRMWNSQTSFNFATGPWSTACHIHVFVQSSQANDQLVNIWNHWSQTTTQIIKQHWSWEYAVNLIRIRWLSPIMGLPYLKSNPQTY